MALPSPTVPQRFLVGDDARALLEHIDETCEGDAERRREYVHARAERSGKAPLHLAAWRGSLDVVRALLEECRADIDQVSTGRHNYGKSPIFYALTRSRYVASRRVSDTTSASRMQFWRFSATDAKSFRLHRDDVVTYLVERGAKVKIVNNKGQSVLSLALSHCNEETIEVIKRAEEREKTWWNFRDTHSDGLKYGDLDARFYPEAAAEPGRGISTRESRRRNFSRLNKGVSWENPDGIDLSGERKRRAKKKKESEAAQTWEELGRILSVRTVGDGDEILDLMEKIVRAETAIAKSGEKPDVASRAADVLSSAAANDVDFRLLRALVGVRLQDCGISDRVLVRTMKFRRSACKILAAAVAGAMEKGAWNGVTPSQLFKFCGAASTYGTIRQSMRVETNDAEPTDSQVIAVIVRACEELNCRELGDIIDLFSTNSIALADSHVLKVVASFSKRMCENIDEDDPTSIAHTAVTLSDFGSRVESWKVPLCAGLSDATSLLDPVVVSKVARRFGESWENDLTAIADEAVVECVEKVLMEDLLERGDYLEAKAYASTSEKLREIFSSNAPSDVVDNIGETLQSLEISTDLPILMPKKRIVLIQDVNSLVRVRETLSSPYCDAFAFDCEWRDPRPMSLLQISPIHTCETFVIDVLRLPQKDISEFVNDVFGDAALRKIAFAPEQDWKRLRVLSKRVPISNASALPLSYVDANVIDLQGEAMNSLASVVADTLGYALDKRCQRSNWDFRPLSEQQKCYAGLDAEVLLDVAARLGLIALQPQSSSLRDDAHLYSSDAVLFRDGTPRFGVDLNATDADLFTEDARRFGANLWESDELLYTTAERLAEDQKNATLLALEQRVYVNEDSTVDRDCPVCLCEICAGEKLMRAPNCQHLYHASCLLSALQSATSTPLRCPMCRIEM